MNKGRTASVEVAVGWRSPLARHTDRYYFDKVNFWRDLLPAFLGDELAHLREGQRATASFGAGELVPAHAPEHVHRLQSSRFRGDLRSGARIEPRVGRFYPRGLIPGVEDSFPRDRRPFRCLDVADTLRVDLNHPLAKSSLSIETTLVRELDAREEHGGRCNDIVLDAADNGPGLQAAMEHAATDFYTGEPFARADSRDDAGFYRGPRLVHHLDASAQARIRHLYGRLLPRGARILDLMSSWTSHLPDHLGAVAVAGLGMNATELDANPLLHERVVHDLNADPRLPFPDGHFDAVVCTASVEYLTRPVEVFRDLARVLIPGAPAIMSWSERWFPPKVVSVWTELHPFERMGLVTDYFVRAGAYGDLHTESIRGLPRPADDKYAATLATADPVYAVWAFRNRD